MNFSLMALSDIDAVYFFKHSGSLIKVPLWSVKIRSARFVSHSGMKLLVKYFRSGKDILVSSYLFFLSALFTARSSTESWCLSKKFMPVAIYEISWWMNWRCLFTLHRYWLYWTWPPSQEPWGDDKTRIHAPGARPSHPPSSTTRVSLSSSLMNCILNLLL